MLLPLNAPLFLLFVALLSLTPVNVYSHGFMSDPAGRGLLGGSKYASYISEMPNAPRDHYVHFPAGNRASSPGAGQASQERAANYNWTPFTPLRRGFVWRAGVCGDLKDKPEHLRGGRYYFNGRIVRTYKPGEVISIRNIVIAHHNGFMELHVCDVSRCGGEISEKCFTSGACRQMKRAANAMCDSGTSKYCGPIDKNYPGRWYLPCSRKNSRGFQDMGGEAMKYVIPSDMECEHCVMHWFWTAANTCNPPGVISYFRGRNRPRSWGNCPGQGGAKGGYTSVQQPCGGRRFPEEYYMCVDIRIKSDGRSPSPPKRLPTPKQNKKSKKKTKRSKSSRPSSSNNPISHMQLVVDGRVVRRLDGFQTINVDRFRTLTIEAVTRRLVSKVEFFINGKKLWTDLQRPYFLYGNRGSVPFGWKKPIMGRTFRAAVHVEGYSLQARVLLK